jgi:hypothetical protein
MMDILYSVLILLGVFAVGFLGVYLKRKKGIEDSDLEMFRLIIRMSDHIVKTFDKIKYKGDISKIMQYVIEAIDFILEYEDIEETELIMKKDLIMVKTREICEREGISLDDELFEIIDESIDFAINNKYI